MGRSDAVAAVFDCDGTLVDSEPLAGEAWRRALKPYGYAVTDEDLANTIGIPYARTHSYLAKKAEIPTAATLWPELSRELFALIDAQLEPFDDALQAVEDLRQRGVRSRSRRRRRASGWTGRWPARAYSSRSRSPATRSSTASPRRTCSCSRPSASA